jgi:GAF domain-containing protein
MFSRTKNKCNTLSDYPPILDINWEASHALALDFCARIIPKVVSSEHCMIIIHDPVNQDVWLKTETGLKKKTVNISLDESSIAAEVIATGTPIIINDLDEKEDDRKRLDHEIDIVVRDMMCLPIRSLDGDRIRGAVQLLNRMYGHKFSDADLQLMEEVAIAIEQSLEHIQYRSQTQGLLQRASLMTRIACMLGLMLAVVITGTLSLYVMGVVVQI